MELWAFLERSPQKHSKEKQEQQQDVANSDMRSVPDPKIPHKTF